MSFGKASLIQGGGLPFAEGGYGLILYARWVSDAPEGYVSDDAPLFLKVAIQPTDKNGKSDGEIALEHYRAGSSEDFIPVNSKGKEVGYGTDILIVGGKQGLNDSTKFAILLDHFIEAGLPEDHPGLEDDTSRLDGLLFAWHRIDEPESWSRLRGASRSSRRRQQDQEKERRKTILVPAEWQEDGSDPDRARDPEEVDAEYSGQREEATEARVTDEASQGSRKRSRQATPRAEATEAGGSRKRGKARVSREEPEAEEAGEGGLAAEEDASPKRRRRKSAEEVPDDDVPFDSVSAAITALKTLCDAKGEVAKRNMKLGLLPILRDNGLTPKQSSEVVALATSNDFLGALEESSGLDWDGKAVASLED